MGYLKNDVFICLDCEATGLDVESDEIVELAIVKFNFQEILQTFDTLVDPERSIPEESIAVHNITNDMVQGKPKIKSILKEAFDLIGNHVIVGHNIGYDLQMLMQAAKKRNIPCPINLDHTIDTVRLARLYGQSPTNTLEDLRKHFNIEEEGAHRALNDVIVNIQVFKELSREFRKTEEIQDRLKRPILLKKMPLGKHKGKLFREVPLDYLHWASYQEFDQDLLFSIEEEKKRRRKRKPFSQSCNPFADL